MKPALIVSPALSHFTELARSGALPHASSGEVKAREIAECLLRNLGGLDDEAQDGVSDFIQLLRDGFYSQAAGLLREKP